MHFTTALKSKNFTVFISALLFLLFDTFVLGISYWIASEVESDALAINIAGRQRMLSQRMTKTLLQMQVSMQYAQHIDPQLFHELSQSSNMFDRTLQAFDNGGQVIAADGRELFQSALDDQNGMMLVRKTVSAWLPMKAAIEKLNSNDKEGYAKEIQPAVMVAIETNSRLLELSNSITNHIENLSGQKTSTLRKFQVLAFFLALANFLVMISSLWKRMSSLSNERSELQSKVIQDPLTGLANRRHLDEYLKEEVGRCSRTGQPISVILIDIDYFKAFNDASGHLEGDRCLRVISNLLHDSINRPSDLAARYGGEEFCIVLPDTDLEGAAALAEMIRAELEGLHVPHPENPASSWVTASLGIASRVPPANYSYKDLLKKADEALYAAKGAGRNRISVYSGQSHIEKTNKE